MFDRLTIWFAMKTGLGAKAAIAAAKRTSVLQRWKQPWLRVLFGHIGQNYRQTLVEARRYKGHLKDNRGQHSKQI
jgi:hypothetical protein